MSCVSAYNFEIIAARTNNTSIDNIKDYEIKKMEKNDLPLETSQDSKVGDESYKLENNSLPTLNTLSIDDEKKQASNQNFQITDSTNDDEKMETNSSIKSYDGSTDNLTLEEFAQYELGETKQIRERSLELIREWVASQQHLKGCCRPEARLRLDDPKCDYATSFLLRFLRVNKFSIKKSTSMMESYIRMKNDYPHWYRGLGDWENEQFMELIDCGYIFVAPGRDKLGRKVVVNLARECDASKYTSSDIMRAMMVTIETLFIMDEETQIKGLSYIFYCKGLTLAHTTLFSPIDMARMFTGCDNNIPLRHRAMFIVSMPYGMGGLINVGKKFLGPVKKRIHVVSNSNTLLEACNSLLNDPEIIPTDIFGETGMYTAKEMAAMWRQHIEANKTYLQNIDDLIIISSDDKRVEEKQKDTPEPESKKSWFGLWSK